MYKKIAALAGSAALVLGVASSAMAWSWLPSSDTTIGNYGTVVNTTSTANSNTGKNSQVAGKGSFQTIFTGDALSMSESSSMTNSTVVNKDCGCSGDVKVTNAGTLVNTTSTAKSNTGKNTQVTGSGWFWGPSGSHQFTATGNAGSGSGASSWTNITVVGSL